jgi:hypothetical protein
MSFELSWEPRGVLRRYYGNVSIEERRRSLELICSDERFDTLRYTITSYLAVAEYEVSDEATAEIAAFHIAPLVTNPDIVIAAVTTRPDIIAAIEHFIELGFVCQPYRVFPTEVAARDWISSHVTLSALSYRPAHTAGHAQP